MKSVILGEDEIKKLYSILKRHRFKEIDSKSEHESYRFDDKENSVFVVCYRTGKVVYRDGDVLRQLIGEAMKAEEGYDYVIGTDEAGKGEWYGPLVVACVALDPSQIAKVRQTGARDSKKLGKKTLQKIGKELLESDYTKEVLILSPESYNERYMELQKEGKTLNDLMAQAHTTLIKNLLPKLEYRKARIVIDMFDYKKTEALLRDIEKGRHIIIQKSKAESETPVAAASIMAKYAFEKEVDRLNNEYGIDLRKAKPAEIPKDIIPKVGKLHFKNVQEGF
jgi:ribonuclease HIII